jgi:CMP-N,N'-diacetyllegionaminic acid synthase
VKKLVIFITARKDSKRLKNKNILKLGSKKLVERTINFAKKLVTNNCIFLSTDSEIAKKTGEKKKIIVPWLRPKNLSKGKISSEKVVLHALRWYENKIDKTKSILLLQPTTPFRSLKFFKNAIKKFLKNPNKNFVSVSSNKVNEKKNSKLLFKQKVLNGGIKKNYILNGSMYLISSKEFKKKRKFVTGSSIGIPIVGEKFKIDIDYLKDFKKAKKYL